MQLQTSDIACKLVYKNSLAVNKHFWKNFKPRPGLLTVGHFIRSNYWTKSIVCKDMNQCQKKTIQKNQQKINFSNSLKERKTIKENICIADSSREKKTVKNVSFLIFASWQDQHTIGFQNQLLLKPV